MNTCMPPRWHRSFAAFDRFSHRSRQVWGPLGAVLLAMGLWDADAAEVANWTAGTTPGSYSEPTHWDLGVVPINSVSETFIIEVPANAKISYDLDGVGRVDALRLGSAATFTLEGTREFAVQGISVLDGIITASGAGAVFRSDATTATLGSRARFSAQAGGSIFVDAPSMELPEDRQAHENLIVANGPDSVVALPGMGTLTTRGGHNGAWNYAVSAVNGGTVDLSGLTAAVGPRTDAYSSDDWLTFTVSGGGQLDLGSLARISLRTRLTPGQDWTLPSLADVEMGYFLPAAGVTLGLPELRNMAAGQISLAENAVLNAPKLATFQNSTLTVAPGAGFHAPQLSDVSNSAITVEAGGVLELGSLSVIDRLSLVARATPIMVPNVTSYELPEDWRGSRRLFEADGAGVSLDLSTITLLKTAGGHGGAWDYSVTAANEAFVDLSRLEEVIGPRTDSFSNDDWLSFYVRSGGLLDLSALRTVSRKVRFLPEAGEPLSLPALEEVLGGQFKLLSGTVLDVPSLRTFQSGGYGAWVEVDFAAEMAAPLLGEFVSVGVTIQPGGRILAPEMTNILNTSLTIGSGGRLQAPKVRDLSGSALVLDPGEELILGNIETCDRLQFVAKTTPGFAFSASSYTTPEDWRTHRTPFEADGVGVHLALGSLEEITVAGANSGSWITSINARNGGSIDLTGLVEALGGRTDAYGADDWLTFHCESGGTITIEDVTVSRSARLQIVGPQARMIAGNLNLVAPARLEVSELGILEFTGGFDFNHTAEAQVATGAALLAFTGPGAHHLEVGGQDAGAEGFTSGNFGIGRIDVGQPGKPSTLLLTDSVNNGNRGAGGEPEALYLYGVDAAGLVLHSGSRLIIGDLNVYLWHEGAMVHLNPLLAGGDTMTFGDGLVARFGGPAIVGMSPSGQTLPVVDHVDVTFNTPINPATFTAADVQLTGSSGAIPVTSVSPQGGNTFRVAFPGQSGHGFVTVRIGPGINDVGRVLIGMDQNGNGMPGDPDDVFETRLLVDTHGPAVAAAVVMRNGGLVGVLFDEEVEPASLADPAHYSIGGTQADSVTSREDGRSVALRFSPVTEDAFILETLNLEDLLGNRLVQPQQSPGTVLPLSSLTVGAPTGVREAFTLDGRRFEILAGGGTVWSSADSCQFYQEPRNGDFDVQLRVVSLVGLNYNARGGIMAREHSGNNSRHLSVVAYQPDKANVYGFHRRSAQGGASDNWGSNISGVTPPNARVRLRREGNDFQAFISTDGADWTLGAETTLALPETLLVGFFVSSEDWNLSRSATATIDDWGEYSPAILRNPQSQTVFQGQVARLEVEARGVGELGYQWYFEDAAMPGATSARLELADIQPSQAGSYHVVVQNAIGSVTSATATVVVDTSDPGAGFEADLMPRASGDGAVGVADWTMVGRIAVGLEEPANASEFTRADCAPRSTLGNGVISVTDWVQAGRYVAGLEPLTSAGGPNGISPMGPLGPEPVPSAARELGLTGSPGGAGQLCVAVGLRAFGNENSASFSVGFDAAALEFQTVRAGADAAGAALLCNPRLAPEGRVGIALALAAGGRLRPGDAELAVIEFRRKTSGPARLELTSSPAPLAAANELADPLAVRASAASYSLDSAMVGVLRITPGADHGTVVSLEYHGVPGTRVVLEVSGNLADWEAATEPVPVEAAGIVRFGQTAGGTRQFFRVRQVD